MTDTNCHFVNIGVGRQRHCAVFKPLNAPSCWKTLLHPAESGLTAENQRFLPAVGRKNGIDCRVLKALRFSVFYRVEDILDLCQKLVTLSVDVLWVAFEFLLNMQLLLKSDTFYYTLKNKKTLLKPHSNLKFLKLFLKTLVIFNSKNY